MLGRWLAPQIAAATAGAPAWTDPPPPWELGGAGQRRSGAPRLCRAGPARPPARPARPATRVLAAAATRRTTRWEDVEPPAGRPLQPRPFSATAARGPGLCHRRPESRRADRTPAVRPASRGAGRPGWPDGAARRACLTGHSARRAGSTPRAPSDGPPRLVRSRAGPRRAGRSVPGFYSPRKVAGAQSNPGLPRLSCAFGRKDSEAGKHGISSSELRRVRRARGSPVRSAGQVGALCAVWGPGLDPLELIAGCGE